MWNTLIVWKMYMYLQLRENVMKFHIVFYYTWKYWKHPALHIYMTIWNLLLNSGYHRIDIIFESEWGYYLFNDNERVSERENAAEALLLFTFENRQTVAASIASICWCYGCRSIISIIFFLIHIFFLFSTLCCVQQ